MRVLWASALLIPAAIGCSGDVENIPNPLSSLRLPRSAAHFSAHFDPASGTVALSPAAGTAPLTAVTESHDGVVGSGAAGTIEIVINGVSADAAVCGGPSEFCVDVSVRNFSAPLDNIYVQVSSIIPASGHAIVDGDESDLPLNTTFGFWYYGTLSTGADRARLWRFGDTGQGFDLQGSVVATTCGDGNCEIGESNSSCAVDCPECATPNPDPLPPFAPFNYTITVLDPEDPYAPGTEEVHILGPVSALPGPDTDPTDPAFLGIATKADDAVWLWERAGTRCATCTAKWVVPYAWHTGAALGTAPSQVLAATATVRARFTNAVNRWNALVGTNIEWRGRRPTDVDYVAIGVSSTTSYAFSRYTGRNRAQQDALALWESPNLNDTGFVLHEMLHATGFSHEHQRPDRGNVLHVVTNNVIPSQRYALAVITDANFVGFGAHDFASIMHYGNWGFCRRNNLGQCVGPTMLRIPAAPGNAAFATWLTMTPTVTFANSATYVLPAGTGNLVWNANDTAAVRRVHPIGYSEVMLADRTTLQAFTQAAARTRCQDSFLRLMTMAELTLIQARTDALMTARLAIDSACFWSGDLDPARPGNGIAANYFRQAGMLMRQSPVSIAVATACYTICTPRN